MNQASSTTAESNSKFYEKQTSIGLIKLIIPDYFVWTPTHEKHLQIIIGVCEILDFTGSDLQEQVQREMQQMVWDFIDGIIEDDSTD